MQKQVIFKTKGMQRDLSASAFNSEYAYKNKNVRVMPTDESTLLSIVNEKGTKPITIEGIGFAVGQAQTSLIMTTIDEMESITNSWNTLIPRICEHSFGFINNGSKEELKF